MHQIKGNTTYLVYWGRADYWLSLAEISLREDAGIGVTRRHVGDEDTVSRKRKTEEDCVVLCDLGQTRIENISKGPESSCKKSKNIEFTVKSIKMTKGKKAKAVRLMKGKVNLDKKMLKSKSTQEKKELKKGVTSNSSEMEWEEINKDSDCNDN